MDKTPLHVQGMHGLGDNLHQRAVMRQLMQKHVITLETSWPSVYHDLVGPDLRLVRKPSGLRTQAKNVHREADKFVPIQYTTGQRLRIAYGGAQVLRTQSKTILEVMCNATGTDYATADYTLPVPQAWVEQVERLVPILARPVSKPLLVYRPLVARPEWKGAVARNADPASYAELFSRIRDTFYVVSVADLEVGREWLVGPRLNADLTLHKGELTFEMMAALFARADVVFTSSGFAAILGPAVHTPTFSVIGGYESVGCHDSGSRFALYKAIGPAQDCACWSSQCHCRYTSRKIEMLGALRDLREFMEQAGIRTTATATPFDQMFDPAEHPGLPRSALEAQMYRGFRA